MEPDDEADVVGLLTRTLGWRDDERHRQLFHWKHRLNPFGSSPGWVAVDEYGLAGFRTLMRWEFLIGGQPVCAVRAVDTATDPRAQGRGIFKALTLRAVEDMTAQGVSCVFNTPNQQSAPGYLSMGWQEMGRLPLRFRPRSAVACTKLLSARTAGDLWSLPTSAGDDAAAVLSDTSTLQALLEAAPGPSGGSGSLTTHRTAEFLQWRYGHCPVGYRAMLVGSSPEDGLVVFRLRRRGNATEAAIADTILPGDRVARSARRLYSRILRASKADYAVALGVSRPRRWLPVPGRGPRLTWRRLSWPGPAPGLADWNLTTGDVELF